MKYTDLMLDLETLGTEADSTVLSFGACLFNPDTREFYSKTFHAALLIDFQGGSIKTSTLAWWLRQSEDARQNLAKLLDKAEEPYLVLNTFRDWIIRGLIEGSTAQTDAAGRIDADKLRVWGNGAGFDQPILRRLARDSNAQLPWQFWNERCWRTIKAFCVPAGKKPVIVLPPELKELTDELTAHDAADDAVKQAIELCVVWPRVKRLVEPV